MLKYIFILFLFFINYTYSETICKPTDTGNGNICISDQEMGDVSEVKDLSSSSSSSNSKTLDIKVLP
jgi:hypothetical protein